MKRWIAFWNILLKDMKAYYLKLPISVGGDLSTGLDRNVFHQIGWWHRKCPVSASRRDHHLILFGTTSMLAVTITFEKKGRSFDRLLLAPIPLNS